MNSTITAKDIIIQLLLDEQYLKQMLPHTEWKRIWKTERSNKKREQLGISQEELARKVGVNRDNFQWELEKIKIKKPAQLALHAAFDELG